ncbi:uncharacterized protein BKCO1_6000135 [Diplodia corticola]|uniref:Uncharacterized protein n=1 Tax=Diplodia corticola TaxID=236234 RepID=A0A1J9RAU6_9PEZI|nr:uncharacterized protein BKCO1_6000135 [Diplodia corticola]OJD37672.1 hypothetical protein BKCO1_6000135 [Diplodia corticola]
MVRHQSQEPFLLRESMETPKGFGKANSGRKGLRQFLVSNPEVILAMAVGIACVMAIFGFTLWLSRQLFECPAWAIGCDIPSSVASMADNLGLVQGIIAAVYAVSMAGPVYTVCALGEAAVWPILNKQAKTLKELDSFLSAARGSIASLPLAYMATRSTEALVVILCITIATITPLTVSPLVGYAYTRHDVSTEYIGNYMAGGVLRNKFIQKNPPVRLPAAAAQAFNLYTSWSSNLSSEAMPNVREFIVNRNRLADRGVVSVNAVKVEKRINCSGHAVELTDYDKVSVTADTKMAGNSSNTTRIRVQPVLTLWVDDIKYVSETRTVSTLVFAAINGTIENGESSEPTKAMKDQGYTGVSAVSCDVDVSLVDSSFEIGSGTSNFTTVSNLDMLEGPTSPESPYGDLGDMAAWFGAVPSVMGLSVHGTQPMFVDSQPLPKAYATWTGPQTFHWKLDTIHKFINVSSGALATSLHYIEGSDEPSTNSTSQTLVSRKNMKRMNPSRAYYLLIPPLVVLAIIGSLASWSYWIHKRANIPIMRLAHVSEVIKSSQTADISEPASEDAKIPNQQSSLKTMKVKFGVATGGVVGLGEDVEDF